MKYATSAEALADINRCQYCHESLFNADWGIAEEYNMSGTEQASKIACSFSWDGYHHA